MGFEISVKCEMENWDCISGTELNHPEFIGKKKVGDVALGVEHLPTMPKACSSIPSTAKKRKTSHTHNGFLKNHKQIALLFFFFLAVLGTELNTLHLPGRHSLPLDPHP